MDDLDFVSKPRHETETDKKNVADGCWLCLASPVHFYDLRIAIFFFELVRQKPDYNHVKF